MNNISNLKTNDDLIKELLTTEEQTELYSEIEQEVKKKRGGARVNSGRKKLPPNNVLKFQVRLSEKEKEFINYAREHKLNYDDLMQG